MTNPKTTSVFHQHKVKLEAGVNPITPRCGSESGASMDVLICEGLYVDTNIIRRLQKEKQRKKVVGSGVLGGGFFKHQPS